MINSILCCSPHGNIPKTKSMATNPFACSVLIRTANHRDEKQLKKAMKPLMTWIDPCLKLIQVSKSDHDGHPYNSEPVISPPTVNSHKRRPTFRVPCPAISIMLFLQENGVLGCRELQKCFNQPPWRLHHRIELVNVHSPDRTLADQRFYQAHTDTPLWSVCPIDAGREHLRINIFVRNFPAMIEFYRIITGVEMESNKDNFCWFPLYSQPGLEIRLSLKCADNVDPYPLETVQLLFEVNNVQYMKTALGVELKFIGSGCYLMNDPDGNFVVLHTKKNIVCPLYNVRLKEELPHRRNYASEFGDDLTTKMSSSTDSSTQKFSTLPRNFAYFKRSTSTSNDSGLFTGSEGSHVDELDPPVVFKQPTSLNSSRRFKTSNQEIRTENTFTDQLRKRFPVSRHNNVHVSFRSDNGHINTSKYECSQRCIDRNQKMTVSAEDIYRGQLSKRYPMKRHNSAHLSFKSDNGYLEGTKDALCVPTPLSPRRHSNNHSRVPPTEHTSRMSTTVRRSNSAVLDFSKYVIKETAVRMKPETSIMSEEMFV